MNNYISHLYSVIIVFVMMACLNIDARAMSPADDEQSNITMNLSVNGKTLKVTLQTMLQQRHLLNG